MGAFGSNGGNNRTRGVTFFCPFTVYWVPSALRVAVVVTPCTSDPASGSVTASEKRLRPEIASSIILYLCQYNTPRNRGRRDLDAPVNFCTLAMFTDCWQAEGLFPG
jgi:hypothetical protein